MPRRISGSRSRSGGSEKSAGGTPRDQEVSLNIYSSQNGHWGVMIYPAGENRGRMYHVRSDERVDPDKFFYDERDQNIESASQSLYGRSRLGRLSLREREIAVGLIQAYAAEDENIPRYSRNTNCQNFATGVIGELEHYGVIQAGNQRFFEQQRGRDGEDIAASIQAAGKSWKQAPDRGANFIPDVRYHDVEERAPPSKLDPSRLNIPNLERLFQSGPSELRGRSTDSQPAGLPLPQGLTSVSLSSRSSNQYYEPRDGPEPPHSSRSSSRAVGETSQSHSRSRS